MAKKVVCECGVVIRGSDDHELVANVQRHGRKLHGMEVTREQALAMAEPD